VDGHGDRAREGLARDVVASFFAMLELDGHGGSVDAMVATAGSPPTLLATASLATAAPTPPMPGRWC